MNNRTKLVARIMRRDIERIMNHEGVWDVTEYFGRIDGWFKPIQSDDEVGFIFNRSGFLKNWLEACERWGCDSIDEIDDALFSREPINVMNLIRCFFADRGISITVLTPEDNDDEIIGAKVEMWGMEAIVLKNPFGS